MCRIIAIVNPKGGTAKTTTTLNLGCALSEIRQKVLLIDFDPQAALTLTYGIDPVRLKQTIYEALLTPKLRLFQIIVSPQNGPDLIPANINLAGAEIELLSENSREIFLKEKLSEVKPSYDFILIDCPPSLGFLTLNALTAANEILIPVQTHYLAFKAVEQLLTIVKKIKVRANPKLKITGFLPTMYHSQTRHSQEVVEELKAAFGKKVYDILIKNTVKFPDSLVVTKEEFEKPPQPRSILRFDPKSEHAKAYRKLAKEMTR